MNDAATQSDSASLVDYARIYTTVGFSPVPLNR
jgi:hypothetical protein